MRQRQGHTYRIIDIGHWTISIGLAYICDGSHREFRIDWFRSDGPYKRHGVTVPKLSFRTAHKHRRVGMLKVWRLQENVLRWLARP